MTTIAVLIYLTIGLVLKIMAGPAKGELTPGYRAAINTFFILFWLPTIAWVFLTDGFGTIRTKK